MQHPINAPPRIGGYRIIRALETGGASDVLLAQCDGEEGFTRTVVLKVLVGRYACDERFATMFARQAAAYGRLAHSGIVQLHELLRLEDQLVVVLEHVDGVPLSRVGGMLRTIDADIDDMAAFHIAAEVFSALAAAHSTTDDTGESTPLIHRYLSPSNVLIGWDGSVKVGDFGLPKPTNVNLDQGISIAKGTDGYMAPEQILGKDVTPRTDVYAGGVILWELLAKKCAFLRTKRRVDMWRAMADPQIEPIDTIRPDIDLRVRKVVRRALEPRVDERSITANEVVAVLRGLVAAEEGREHLAGLMAMVRPDSNPRKVAPPPVMALSHQGPPQIKRRSTTRIAAAKPKANAEASVPTQVVSGEMPAAKVSSAPAPRRTSTGKMRAVQPPVAPAPRRTSTGKMPAIRPAGPAAAHRKPPPPTAGTAAAPARTLLRQSGGDELAGVEPAPALPRPGHPSSFASLPKVLVVEIDRSDLPQGAGPKDVHSAETKRPPAEPSVIELGLSAIEALPVDERRTSPGLVDDELGTRATEVLPADETRASPVPVRDELGARGVDSVPATPPTRNRSRYGTLVIVAFVMLGGLVVAGRFAYVRVATREQPDARATIRLAEAKRSDAVPSHSAFPTDPAAPSSDTASTSSDEASASASTSAESAAEPTTAPTMDPGMGLLKTTSLAGGRRIFVDDLTVGQTPESVLVKCGSRRVQIGSSGRKHVVEVPCGGEISVGAR